MMMAKAAKAGLKVADFIGQASATTTELAWLIEMLTPKKEWLSAIIISMGRRWRRRKSCPKKPSMEFPLYMSFQVMNQTLMDFKTSFKLSQTTHPSLEMTDQRL